MKKKIITILLLCMFLLISLNSFSVISIENNKSKTIEDNEPPEIILIHPQTEVFYLLGNYFYTGINKIPISLGKTPIEVIASDESGIDRVELFINDDYIGSMTEVDYPTDGFIYTWSEKVFGFYTIKTVAYDTFGNSNLSEIRILKIF